jgi:hypothetical protein
VSGPALDLEEERDQLMRTQASLPKTSPARSAASAASENRSAANNASAKTDSEVPEPVTMLVLGEAAEGSGVLLPRLVEPADLDQDTWPYC